MKQTKTTLKELSSAYRIILHRFFLYNAIALGVFVGMPAYAGSGTLPWSHPDDMVTIKIIDFVTIDSDINHSLTGGNYNVVTGTGMRNIVNGNANLTLNNITQKTKQYGVLDETGIYGSLFIASDYDADDVGLDVTPASGIYRGLQQKIKGETNITISDSYIEGRVIGHNFFQYKPGSGVQELTDSGAVGKTTITLNDTYVGRDLRGVNFGQDEITSGVSFGDIEININNSFIKENVVAVGSNASAGNVVINVKGNSVIGYESPNSGTKTAQSNGGIIAGATNANAHVASTTINLDTDGADNTIRIAGDVLGACANNVSGPDTDTNGVLGNATVNILGGGDVDVGGDIRAYHADGNTTLNLAGTKLNVDGTVQEFDTINIDKDSVLTADTLILDSTDVVNIVLQDQNNYGKLVANNLDANGAKLNMLVHGVGDYDVMTVRTKTSDFTYNLDNALYNLTPQNGMISVAPKSSDDIVKQTGLSRDAGNTVSALAKSPDADAGKMALVIQDAIAKGDVEYVEKEAAKVNSSKIPLVSSVALNLQNQVMAVAGERMALPLVGRSGGDLNADFGIWAKGAYNHTKHKDLFSGNTWAGSIGVDTDINHSVIVGLGYSFSNTDVDLHTYNVDIDSNTLFLYGQYGNKDWFVNGTVAYTMSNYQWQKSIFGIISNPEYKVNVLSEQVIGGYHFDNGITPTVGLRYMDIHRSSYKDSAFMIGASDATYLTTILGADYKYVYIAPYKSVFWTPELRIGATYDVLADADSSVIVLPGAIAYNIGSDRLSRLGGEFGVGLTAEYFYLTVSLDYDLTLHQDYVSHTGSLKAKYKF